MKPTYKIGQKVRITSDKEVLGTNDMLSLYLGDVVTIKSVDEDCAYTVEEIDGIELLEIDIECLIRDAISDKNIKFDNWSSSCQCPHCDSDSFTSSTNFDSYGDFDKWNCKRFFTCDICKTKWTEEYSLKKVTCEGFEKTINIGPLPIVETNKENISRRYAIVKDVEDEGTQTLEDYGNVELAKEAFEFIRENGYHETENDGDKITFEDLKVTFSLDCEVWDMNTNTHLNFEIVEHTPIHLVNGTVLNK